MTAAALDVLGSEPQVILDCQNQLGECVLWNHREGRLWWTNIHAAELWSWDPFGASDPKVHAMPERVGAFGFRDQGGLVLGLASGFALYDPASGRLGRIVEIEPDLPTTRLNDGRVDPFGRFVCGGMDESTDQQPLSAVYVLDERQMVTRLIDKVHCANSICWSPDGRQMYFTDMPTQRIDTYAYGRMLSDVEPRGVLARLPGPGLADGSQVDVEGCLWNAEWGGGRLVRYAPDGSIVREIALPVSNPTCVTFGGPDLDILFVTTARFGIGSGALEKQPQAGALLALKPGVRGRQEYFYAG